MWVPEVFRNYVWCVIFATPLLIWHNLVMTASSRRVHQVWLRAANFQRFELFMHWSFVGRPVTLTMTLTPNRDGTLDSETCLVILVLYNESWCMEGNCSYNVGWLRQKNWCKRFLQLCQGFMHFRTCFIGDFLNMVISSSLLTYLQWERMTYYHCDKDFVYMCNARRPTRGYLNIIKLHVGVIRIHAYGRFCCKSVKLFLWI